MQAFDPGPPEPFATIFANAPDYAAYRQHFWYDWGQVFHRGRLDGSARVLAIASDPGPTERVAGRTLVGDAGQRVQGFFAKLGLTRSYLCLNAFTYALFPSHGAAAPTVLGDPTIRDWRNGLFDAAASGGGLAAVIAFGSNAQKAVDLWSGLPAGLPVVRIPHPSSHNAKALADGWRAAIVQLRATVTPDADGDPTLPNYGATVHEADYAAIPRFDLPFGAPPWLGDDSAGRKAKPRHNNTVSRPSPDDRHTLIWQCPATTP